MATINASTKHTIRKKIITTKSAPGSNKSKKGAAPRRGSVAPPLRPVTLNSDAAIDALLLSKSDESDSRVTAVTDLFRQVLGEPSSNVLDRIATPHAASTTRDRAGAAADVAVAAKHLGVPFVLKECGILNDMQRMLFPQGIERMIGSVMDDEEQDNYYSVGGLLRPSTSAVSLVSLDGETTTVTSVGNNSFGTDTKRGKTTPANAREGCLLLIRALCEIVGKPAAEPYVVGAFLAAALDECASSSSAIRQAAEDAATAMVSLANPWAFSSILCPLLLKSLRSSNEWRVKANSLERLQQCATLFPDQVQRLVPILIPAVTSQVWDTKAQVSKGARSALLAICETNTNKDIQPTIPAIVAAICKPAETTKAVSELMSTTFVVPVDKSTLAILCPVLARALKEKLAVHKRAACIVISNMSKLVESPDAVAPFENLLVPELKRVCANVQFEEIRDEALQALAHLTKALGDSYNNDARNGNASSAAQQSQSQQTMLQAETANAEAEQQRIQQKRQVETEKEDERKRKEEEERKKFKEAMDAQRELDKHKALEAQKKRQEEELQREKLKLSTKAAGGKCQACGLKKCKKSCVFYSK